MTDALSASDDQASRNPNRLKIESSPWDWWRCRMPIADDWAYLDHAAVGPLSGPAAQAIAEFARQASEQGDTVWPVWNTTYERLRRQAAAWIHSEVDEICLVPNTTTGVNLVAQGWPFETGDNVVIPEGEFPSNLFPWMHQAGRGVELRVVPRRGTAVNVDDLISHCDRSTRIIAVSWVGFATGFRVDLDDLVHQAHSRGIAVFVDAIQGMGMYPLDVRQTPIDFLAIDGHKWLLGPEGIGFAYVARRHLDRLRPMNVGWASVKESHNYSDPKLEFRDSASRFESGSANMVGAAALDASLDLFHQIRDVHGPQAIAQRVCHLASLLIEKIRFLGAVCDDSLPPIHRSGIVNFQIPKCSSESFRKAALAEKVVLSCRGGGIRASIHAYNNENDLDRLAAIVHKSQTVSTNR